MGLRTMKRRRRENKTDYKLRLNLLKSGLDRIVIRRTNRYFIVQAVSSSEGQDRVTLGITSKELLKYGWDPKFSGSLKSVPAGYLTGLLMAKKLKKKEFVVDLGMARTIKGCRVFAVVRGLVDGGLKVSAGDVFSDEGRLVGEHMGEELKKMIASVRERIENGK
ncbi:50S ribosomal protein L18 [Candidatus Pacearchaeota archaeon]|nr:MAG: 50S ribosomal protein L18 [Candidatus Pacearchaeota archaeon]